MTYQRQDSAPAPGGANGGKERQYVGKGKWIEFRNGGGIHRISLTPQGIELICRNQNSGGWVNLVMTEMRQPDKQGNQYTIYVDDYVPTNHSGGGRTSAPRPGGERRYNDGGFGGSSDSTGPRKDHSYGPEDDPVPPEVEDDIEDDIPF